MYYFNYKLLSELDKVLGMTHTEINKRAGFGLRKTMRWVETSSLSVGEFVHLLNTYRLSMADFLITKETVPVSWRKEDYVIPFEL